VLDARSVLVVDEAGMVGSRKLGRLLDHAREAGAKVVLVGDDRQLGAIDAGGGFCGLRVRLGASELTENRRQRHAWERDALELVRDGQVDQAVAAYREHQRMVPASSKTPADAEPGAGLVAGPAGRRDRRAVRPGGWGSGDPGLPPR
jgi:ATP-dependent exoDNAse (exonuclease V) alpha subunit